MLNNVLVDVNFLYNIELLIDFNFFGAGPYFIRNFAKGVWRTMLNRYVGWSPLHINFLVPRDNLLGKGNLLNLSPHPHAATLNLPRTNLKIFFDHRHMQGLNNLDSGTRPRRMPRMRSSGRYVRGMLQIDNIGTDFDSVSRDFPAGVEHNCINISGVGIYDHIRDEANRLPGFVYEPQTTNFLVLIDQVPIIEL
jgi:hypothetical protein